MSYAKHYIIQSAARSGQLYTVEIWEKDYTGDPETMSADLNPFIHKLLAQSDDPFAPKLPSTLTLSCDTTVFETIMPDFLTNDDRKYWVKLICGATPGTGNARLLLRNYQGGLGIRKSSLIVLVNGAQQIMLSGAGTIDGQLIVNAGDIVTIQQSTVGGVLMGSTWGMEVDDTATELFSGSTSTPSGTISFEYTFMAMGATTYRAKTHVAGTIDYPDTPEFKLWQGFILNDEVQQPFVAGRQALVWDCVDGLPMLASIPYEPSTVNSDINILESLLQIVQNCLGKIGLPDGYYLNICVSIYGDGMNDRGDGSQYEPFSQAYYAPRNWLKSDGTYESCLEVLQHVMLGWGCQIFQSNNEWWVVSVNERFEDEMWFTKYDEESNLIDSGQIKLPRTILPKPTGNTTVPVYFRDKTQVKILRKGYRDIQMSCPADYAYQCIDNGDMSRLDGSNFPINWNPSSTIGAVTATSLGPYNAINIAPTGGGPTERTPSVAALSAAKGFAGDQVRLSFLIDGQTTPSATVPKVFLQVLLQGVGPSFTTYWLDDTNNWQLQTGPDPIPDTRYYPVIGHTSGTYETVSIETPPLPINGSLFFKWVTDNFATQPGGCTIANVKMTFESPNEKRLIKNNISDPVYKKEIEIRMGGPSTQFNYSQRGSIVDSTGTGFASWYRYGDLTNKDELLRVIYQQYFNIISKPSINFNATIRSLYSEKDTETDKGVMAPMDTLKVDDTTACAISANGKTYILSTATFDYTSDTLNATLLETANTDLAATITDIVVPKA